MARINPDKALNLLPLKYQIASADQPLAENWLVLLGDELIKQLNLQADAVRSADIHRQLNNKVGESSTYTYKKELLKILSSLYLTLIDPKILPQQRITIAMKIVEGLPESICTPGFHNRCAMCTNTILPANLDELLSLIRQDVVARTAHQSTDEVHAHNRFFTVANNAGYGVRPINMDDVYRGNIKDDVILEKLKAAFETHYTPMEILNALIDHLKGLMLDRGYEGRLETGYGDIYHQFSSQFLAPFIGKISELALWEMREEEDENEDIITKPIDINWLVLKRALLCAIKQQAIVDLSPEEETTYQAFLVDEASPKLEMPLTATTNDLLQLMTFLQEWPATHKVAHILAHLGKQPAEQHDGILASLCRQHPSLLPVLKTVTEWDVNKYVDAYLTQQLHQAANAGDLTHLMSLVEQGVSITPVLTLLMSPMNKSAFMDEPTLRQGLSISDLQYVFAEGKYQGKTVAEVWIASQRGRYWLAQDEILRTRMIEVLGEERFRELHTQADRIKLVPIGKLFTPVSANLKTFLQLIARGEQGQAEAMLNAASSAEKRALLTGKATVRDYADETGRLLKGTALGIALGEEDVKYHDGEEAMTEMLMKHLRQEDDGEALIAEQIEERFPEGWEEIEKARATRDETTITNVFDDIEKATTPDEIEQVIQGFKAYLSDENKGKDGNKVFKQGKCFNMDLLMRAFDLYDERFDRNGGNWNSPKNLACWRKIIGSIQRYLPTPYMQATAQGVYYIVEGGRYVDDVGQGTEHLKRSMNFSYNGKPFFKGSYGGAVLVLGVDYAGAGGGGGGRSRGRGWWLVESLQKLMSGKNNNIGKVLHGHTESIKHVRSRVGGMDA